MIRAWRGLILFSCVLCFGTLADAGFVKWDDIAYVSENPHVRAGLTWGTIRWAFAGPRAANYHPLTWLSHALDWQTFGSWAGGHHLVNIALHTANALLLFSFLRRVTGAVHRSGVVSLLFALHPLHVESVAWVSERKDVLSTCLELLALCMYAHYLRRPCLYRYLLVVGLFIAGLLCKPMLVTFPFLLLLLDYWPLDRFKIGTGTPWPIIREKLPLIALSIVACVVTYHAQKAGGAVSSLHSRPALLQRLGNAAVACAFYLNKTVLPVDLAFLYPHPGTWPADRVALSAGLFLGVSLLSLPGAKQRPHLAVGWLWFLGLLVPTVGLVQVGTQAYADRYTYLPLCGLFLMAAWSVPEDWARRYSLLCVSMGATVLLGLGLRTADQVATWHSSEDLFTHGIAVVPNNPMAFNWLGVDAVERGDLDQAVSYYERALELEEREPWPHCNLANLYAGRGSDDQAIAHLTRAAHLFDLHQNDPFLATALKHRPSRERAAFYRRLARDLEGHDRAQDAARYAGLAP